MLTPEWRKASYSNPSGCCLEAAFRKSTYSFCNSNCAEAAALRDGTILVRDSNLGEASPVLEFTPAAWSAFLATL